MLQIETYEDVIQFNLQRKFFSYLIAEVNAFLVDGLLINTGPAILGKEMLRACKKYSLQQIVNTHHHEAHIGNNALLQREFSLPIRAHREALPVIRQPRENLPLNWQRRLLWGRPVMAKARRIGNVLRTPQYLFRVLPTPGPSSDHICLYEEKKAWLFMGDLILDRRAKTFYPLVQEQQLLESLKKVALLRPSVIFCATNGIILEGSRFLQRKIDFWEETLGDRLFFEETKSLGLNHVKLRKKRTTLTP